MDVQAVGIQEVLLKMLNDLNHSHTMDGCTMSVRNKEMQTVACPSLSNVWINTVSHSTDDVTSKLKVLLTVHDFTFSH